MPKMKTNKSAAKRFKITGSGKIRRQRANKNHILEKKSKNRKRRLRTATLVDKSNVRQMRTLLVA